MMRKKYPSKIRYEENNPSITFRVTKEEKESIEQMAEEADKSISTLVRIALLHLHEEMEDMYGDAYNYGYDIGCDDTKKNYAISYPCSVCGSLCVISPNSECHKAVLQFLQEKG